MVAPKVQAAAPDTTRIAAADAFRRALASAPEVAAAELRVEAALAQADQAARLPNPQLSVEAENLGLERSTTGFDRPRGIEGQAVLNTPLPLGPRRAGSIAVARAQGRAAEASAVRTTRAAAESILGAMAELARSQTVAANARQELEAVERLAEALDLQAREGRAPASDASRARLAQGLAATSLARKETALAQAVGEMARRLGLDPDAWVELDIPACTAPSLRAPVVGSLPEVDAARARLDAAEAQVTVARGQGRLDFTPAVGLLRAQGSSALFLGFSTTLPVFDLGSRRIAAARSEERAVEAELAALELRLAVERTAAERSLEAVEAAGAVFDEVWLSALEQTVNAAQVRYDLGEGSLFELLDGRRARLQALDDYAQWQSEWWQARARLLRLSGAAPDASVVCTDPQRDL